MLHGQHQLRFNTAYTDHTSRLTHTRHARRTYPVCKARDSSTEATYANERVQSGLASSAELQQAPQLSAAEAYQQGSLAFGFAAGGLLFPVSGHPQSLPMLRRRMGCFDRHFGALLMLSLRATIGKFQLHYVANVLSLACCVRGWMARPFGQRNHTITLQKLNKLHELCVFDC